MNERERLLAILYAMPEAMKLSEMADYLLEHGITVPPTEMDGEYAEKKTIERRVIIEELNHIGGCDASDEWSKGFDAAIEAAIKIAETAPTIKVGDTVYIKGDPVEISFIHIEDEIYYCVQFDCAERDCSTCPFYEDEISWEGEHNCKTYGYIEFTANDIGKTVFLTREDTNNFGGKNNG